MAFFQNLFNKQQVPQLDFIQLDATGQIDPVESAKLNQASQPRTLGERLFGKTYSTDVQEINPETNEVKLATTETFRPGFFNDLASGYKDNYDNGFNVNNLRNNNQNIATRLGEGLGTVGRFVDSPLGRGLIAAGLNKALGYDDSFLEGLQAFAGRQNAVTADKLYRKQLKDYGYTDEDLSQIRGNITSDVYKNLANNLYKTKNLDQNTYIKLKKAYDTQLQMGILSPEQYQTNVDALNNQYVNSQVQTMQAGDVGLSNQTRNTNSQIDYRTKRLEQLDIQLQQNQQKIGILQQRVANGVANDAQKAELRALTIQQKQLENQILGEYIGNGGGGNPQPTRPVGTPAPKNNTPKTSGLKFVGVRNK